jgi:hypothetical protein
LSAVGLSHTMLGTRRGILRLRPANVNETRQDQP